MTFKEFAAITGHEPIDDDLERANCNRHGAVEHDGCGVCMHDLPRFKCKECFMKALQGLMDYA